MVLKIGVIMDPISSIHIKKDSTFAILLEAQNRQFPIYYMEQHDLFFTNNKVFAKTRRLKLKDNTNDWFEFLDKRPIEIPLSDLDIILMRKDPPVNMDFIYTTQLLDLAKKEGVLVVNDPKSLRDANEKTFVTWFKDCYPPSLISANIPKILEFLGEHKNIIIKALNSMGGSKVYKATIDDPNINIVLQFMTNSGKRQIMAQKFISAIDKGDKRILLIDGKPIPYALSRIPADGDIRGNLAAGATGVGSTLTKKDLWICAQVGETLKNMGLFFVGIDIIGEYLTEINVTSPTCIREIDKAFDVNIAKMVIDALMDKRT